MTIIDLRSLRRFNKLMYEVQTRGSRGGQGGGTVPIAHHSISQQSQITYEGIDGEQAKGGPGCSGSFCWSIVGYQLTVKLSPFPPHP